MAAIHPQAQNARGHRKLGEGSKVPPRPLQGEQLGRPLGFGLLVSRAMLP